MGFRIFETPRQYRVFASDNPSLTLTLGYDAYIYTGLVPATWILPQASSRFSRIDVAADPQAALVDLQVQGGANQIKNPAPTNSLLIFPGVKFSMLNENNTYWIPTT